MAHLRLSAAAQADIVKMLAWTTERFGIAAQERYERLLSSALVGLLADPERIGSAPRPELGDRVRSYHLRHSKRHSGVARPRHLILYRIGEAGAVEIGRVLHDAMELERHAQFEFPPELRA
jgi:toxin ParE1/3/4